MKLVPSKKGKIAIGLSFIGLVILTVILIKADLWTKKEEIRYREYPVVRGDIIAGVEGSGSIYYEKVEHILQHSGVIGEVHVKEGQLVKKGDRLISFLEEWIIEREKELMAILTKAENDLADGRGSLKMSQEKYNQTIENLKNEGRMEYETARQELEQKLNLVKEIIVKKESENQDFSEENSQLASIQASMEELDRKYEETKRRNQATSSTEKKTKEVETRKQGHANELLEKEVEKAKSAYDEFLLLKEKPYVEALVEGIVLKTPENIEGKGEEQRLQAKGSSVITIGDASKKMVKIFVVQEDIGKIKEGQKVQIQTSAFEDITFLGVVNQCMLKSVEQGGVIYYPVEVALDATTEAVLDGMTAYATFIIKEKKEVLTLSNKAIFMEDKKQYVRVKGNEGELIKREITTGFSDGSVSEVLSGLKENDMVVVEG